MKTFQNLTLIGTSHISKQSVNEVINGITIIQPEIVALELDKTRLLSLTKKEKRKVRLADIRKIGVKGYLFSLIGGYIQKKMGKLVNMEPGAEMLAAIQTAAKFKLKLALVDQPIEITLKRFSKELTWKEKFRLLQDIFFGIFFKKREMKKYGLENFDLTKVPEEKVIKVMIKALKQRYPSMYKVLIEERNEVLAKNLSKLMQKHETVLAVVGAGHQEELIRLIKQQI